MATFPGITGSYCSTLQHDDDDDDDDNHDDDHDHDDDDESHLSRAIRLPSRLGDIVAK